jgi:hypothetical protein
MKGKFVLTEINSKFAIRVQKIAPYRPIEVTDELAYKIARVSLFQ